MNVQRSLYGNIILSGGSSNFPGIKGRLLIDLSKHVPESTKVNVIASPERELSSWIGGSIIGSLPNFSEMVMTKLQYKENGNQYSN